MIATQFLRVNTLLFAMTFVLPVSARGQVPRTAIDTTFTFAKNGAVEVNILSGRIHVATWKKPVAKINVTTVGGNFDFISSQSRVTIDQKRAGLVDVVLTIPAGARIRLHSVSAPMTIQDVTGTVDAKSISGDIEVSGALRRLEVETISGVVHVNGSPHDVYISDIGGDISVDSATGEIEVKSVSGSVKITNARSPRARIETIAGLVSYAGTLDVSGQYDITSQSGAVMLTLPSTSDASIRFQTYSGRFRNTHHKAIRKNVDREGDVDHTEQYQLGQGKAKVNIVTFSGIAELKTPEG